MEEVTAEMKAAQPGVAERYREHCNDQERLYVCACRGERNKEATGECTRLCGLWTSAVATGKCLPLPPRAAARGQVTAAIFFIQRQKVCVFRGARDL